MKFYSVASYSVCLQTNEVKCGFSESENLGEVIIDVLEDECMIETVKDIIKERYERIDIETVSRYYSDGDVVVSKPIIIEVKQNKIKHIV